MREICLDTETTGLNPERGDRIFEIGCVELIDKRTTGRNLRLLINPEKDLSVESREITGFTNDDLIGKPLFKDVVDEFLEFIGESSLIAHNAGFDIKFINSELRMVGYCEVEPHRVVDSLDIAKKKYPGQKNNLNALCKRLDVDITARNYHGALLDAELLAEVYIKMMVGTGQVLMFNTGQIYSDNNINPKNLSSMQNHKRNFLESRKNFSISEEDLKKHKDFIDANIKNSNWYSD